MPRYIISYDISDSKRLAKLARVLQKTAIRIQYSVFLYIGEKSELHELVESINAVISQTDDDVRIYTIQESGFVLGNGIDLDQPFLL